jgi:hypothetical protein
LVEISDVFIGDSALLIGMLEDLGVKSDIYFIGIDHFTHLLIGNLFNFRIVERNIELFLCPFCAFLDQALLVDLHFDVCHSGEFELVLHVCFFNVVHHHQIYKVGELLRLDQFFLTDEIHQKHDFRDIRMVLFLLARE